MLDPTIGRFTTLDPIGFDAGDPNLYRYVENNPTNRVDPSGLVAQLRINEPLGERVALGQFGAFFWPIQFYLVKGNAGPKGGAIIQRVSITWDITVTTIASGVKTRYKTGDGKDVPGMTIFDPKSETKRQIKTEYLEAWQVGPGGYRPKNPQFHNIQDSPFQKMMENYGVMMRRGWDLDKAMPWDDMYSIGPVMIDAVLAHKKNVDEMMKDRTTVSKGTITFKGKVAYYENADDKCLRMDLPFVEDTHWATGAGGLLAVWDHTVGKKVISLKDAEDKLKKLVDDGKLEVSNTLQHEISITWDSSEFDERLRKYGVSEVVPGSKKP